MSRVTMSPVLFEIRPLTPPTPEQAVAFVDRLQVIGELMGTLEVVTHSGQGYVMQRVLNILRMEVAAAEIPPGHPENAILVRALSELQQEAGRIAPNHRVFSHKARFVVHLLWQIERELNARDEQD